jgi:hypothetical protein
MPYTPVRELNAVFPTRCPHLLAVREQYADDNWYVAAGYICYSRGEGRLAHEHRLVAQHAFGEIPPTYHVHHIDHVMTNNDADNLALVSRSMHAILHHVVALVEMRCAHCGKLMLLTPRLAARRRFCGRRCHRLEKPGRKPPREALVRQLRELGSWCAVARAYGVTDMAVRKWAKGYGLDLSILGKQRRTPEATTATT